jgi:large subunit ribosomal protein L9
MDVILREDFPALGYVGDHVAVKAGYARNYLIPRGIAVEGSSKNARELEHKLAGIQARKAKLKSIAEGKKTVLESLKLEFSLKIGSNGKSFGSVSHKDVHEAFLAKGQELDRKQVKLLEPIKSGGSFTVEVRLHSEVAAVVPIEVATELVKSEAGKKSGKKHRREDDESAEEFDIDAIEAAAEDQADEPVDDVDGDSEAGEESSKE